MLSGYVRASAADVLRSAQKDREYVLELRHVITEAVRALVPPRLLGSRVLRGLEVASTALYYTSSSVLGAQTLGEEYCDLFQVDAGTNAQYAPTLTAHVLMTAAHAFGAHTIRAVLRAIARTYGLLIRDEPLNAFISWTQRVHLAIFYLTGSYYEFPKRIAGIIFLRVAAIRRLVPRYHLLGILLSIQVAFAAFKQIKNVILSAQIKPNKRRSSVAQRKPILERIQPVKEEVPQDEEEPSAISADDRQCTLCLSKLTDATATECGHVFCWNCIAEWCSSQELCPLCRQRIQVRGLLCLYHY